MGNRLSPRQAHLDFLEAIRAYELGVAKVNFPDISVYNGPCRLLELGAGTGAQAKKLSGFGYKVTALDIAGSHYRNVRCFEVLEYDGVKIPFSDSSFDVVFSSHVLEHVINLDDVLKEIYRVLSDEGICIHLIPTPACRSWTLVTHYVWLVRRIAEKVVSVACRSTPKEDAPMTPSSAKSWLWTLLPPRHGERGNTFSEIYFYSKFFWKRKFKANNFEVIKIDKNDLFYTMSNSIGKHFSVSIRGNPPKD